MPTLKQITCQLEKEPSLTPLKEYSTNYGDGIVETFVAIPDGPCAFGIHLTSSGYIAPGLGMYVFMDGVYQCNRLRRSLMMPDGTITPDFYAVDFRVRQKEEKLESGGRFLGREWRFEKLNIADADANAAPNVDDTILGNIGTIEVVILRLYGDQSEAMPSTPEASNAEQIKATPPKTQPARNERARVEPRRTGQHANKKSQGVAVKAGFLRRQPSTDGRGIFDGAGDDPEDDNFGAAFDGPSERRFYDRNYYHYDGDDRAHQSRHSHHRRVSPSPPPRSDYGPSYADYLRWKDSHPDAAAYRGRERQRATSYYEQYRPDGREDSRDPRERDDLGEPSRHHQRRRARAEDGIPLTKERSFWTFDSSNGDIDTLPDHRHGHRPRSSREIRLRDGVPVSESQSSYGTSTELEATRRPRVAEELAASRLHSAIDSATPPRARPIYKVRHAHFQDGYPGDGRPKGNPVLPKREYVSDEFSQPLFNLNDHPRSSFRRNEPDASLASSHRGPDPRYNPRYPPGHAAPLQHYDYTPDDHGGNSKMPGGWEDPYDAAATPNPFATRFVDQNQTGSPTRRAVSSPQVITIRRDEDNQQNQGSTRSHHSNSSHRSHNSSRHSSRKAASGFKTSGAALNNQDSAWGARGDGNGGQDGGWNSGSNNDGAQGNTWDTSNKPEGSGVQGCDGSNGGNISGWDNPKGQEQGGQQDGRADGSSQQNAGATSQWGTAETNNADATKSEWNNDSSGNQEQGGWNSAIENNQADNTKNQNDQWGNQNEDNKSSNSSSNEPFPDLDKPANQEDTNNWDIPVDNTANQENANKWGDTGDKTAHHTNAGNWDTPADASDQQVSGNWDVQPAAPTGANTVGSRTGIKAGSKAPSDSTGSFMHRPVVLEQPYVKGYWKDWSQPRSTPRAPQAQPHAPNAPDDATDIYAPSEVPYVVPEETAREKAVNQYVHAGKGFNYSHITARPKYMDSLEQPYAIFRFKYRSRDMLGKILGRRTKAVIDKDAEQEKVEERKRRLSELSKEELVQQVLQNSNAAGGSQKAELQMAGSQKAPSGNLSPIPEKPPSVSKWVEAVAGATTEGQESSDGPGICNRCQNDLVGGYWHCKICDDDDYDICCHCVVDKKLRCNDDSHELAKWKEDMDLGNGMKGVKATGEILPPVVKSSASKKGGSRSGGGNNNWAPDASAASGGNASNWGVDNGAADPAGNTGGDQWTADTTTVANAGDNQWAANTITSANAGAGGDAWNADTSGTGATGKMGSW